MSNSLQNQRTYAFIGTSGCGKTSIAEMLLFQSGIINRLGSIEDGTTALDYEPEEIKRRGSIQPGFANFTWNKNPHSLIDIPGDNNFNADTELLLKAVDGAVLVIDAIDGVRPQTKKCGRISSRKNFRPLFSSTKWIGNSLISIWRSTAFPPRSA